MNLKAKGSNSKSDADAQSGDPNGSPAQVRTGWYRKMTWCVALVVGAICLLKLGTCTIVPSPRSTKLADCAVSELNFAYTVQGGGTFSMVVGVPHPAQRPPSFKGDVIVRKSGTLIGEFPIGSDDMQECNWLHESPELQGYILTWRHGQSGAGFNDLLQRGGTYDFTVKFSQMPPAGSSLWLHWLE